MNHARRPAAVAADPVYSVGPFAGDVAMEHMQLILKRSPAQEAALATTMDALHDNTSPQYQQWLTVDQYAAQFGVSPADIAVISGWLTARGFTIDSVPPSRMFIEFSGVVAQVNAAFHTEPFGAYNLVNAWSE